VTKTGRGTGCKGSKRRYLLDNEDASQQKKDALNWRESTVVFVAAYGGDRQSKQRQSERSEADTPQGVA
jgi:hypothetical protein